MNHHPLAFHHMVQLYHILLSGSELWYYLPQDCIVTSWRGSCKKRDTQSELIWVDEDAMSAAMKCVAVCWKRSHFYWTLQNTFPRFERVNDPGIAIITPSRPLTQLLKDMHRENPELQAERNLRCAQLLQNTLREEHIIKTKYFDILAKCFEIILVLILLDTKIQLSNKNQINILVYSHSFSSMYKQYFFHWSLIYF